MTQGLVLFRRHAWQRMLRRGITGAEVRQVLATGQAIEEYPEDTPYPSAPVLAIVDGRPLHVVRAIDPESGTTYVVTAYQPDPTEWDETFRHRRTP